MTITAKSILASVSQEGKRIDTLLLRNPRFIHSEFMTHRQFSRNASSSRAIPVARLIEDVERDPAMPIFWGKNQPGMQAREELDEHGKDCVYRSWMFACHDAVEWAKIMAREGAHKQIVNRILEPFAHINVVVTSTEWENFDALRIHEDAQPEIKALAEAMKWARERTIPEVLEPGQWHLPFVTLEEIERHGGLEDPDGILRIVSAARCARTSYKTHDGRVSTLEEDWELGKRLTKSVPFHASPFEHQATPDSQKFLSSGYPWDNDEMHRNFVGWIQNRAFMEEEL